MDAEARYTLEALDRALKDLGCEGGRQGNRWLWRNPHQGEPGHMSYFSFVPDKGRMWIRERHVVTAALRLEKDPNDVVRRIRDLGGEILDP